MRDYDRLKAALDRLQSTTLMTSIRQPTDRRRRRLSWIDEWKETADAPGHARGTELVLPDWLYTGILNDALVLTIDRGYFDLTGGLERWLYRKSAQTALFGIFRRHSTMWRFIVNDLTTVELLWLEKRIENRIRFGRPVAEQIIDRRRILSFAPGTVFAFVRWASNDFGTVIARVDILRAATPGQRYSTVPWVKPGGNILLRLTGWPKVERVLQLIDAVEALDIHPADVAPDYWHHVHNRLSVNETPRSYTRARHQAWLRRQRIAP